MKNFTKLMGIIAVVAVIGFGMVACGDGGGDDSVILPEQKTTKERWEKYVDPSSTATINLSVAPDDVCTITVGGTAMLPLPGDDGVVSYWNSTWKASAGYLYTVVKGKAYTYTFEAWTDGAERTLNVQWYTDNVDSVYQNTGYSGDGDHPPLFTINSTRQGYSLTSELIPKSGVQELWFHCANQTGKFYVKIISIKANTGDISPEATAFINWLSEQDDNTVDTPHTYNLKIDNAADFTAIRTALNNNPNKYVYLDLSGSTITTIPNFAFCGDEETWEDCATLTGITIPDSVITIGRAAFAECTNLTNVTLGNRVTSIGVWAFDECTGLTSITIPNSVTNISGEAFSGCTGLTAINVAANNTAYTFQDGVLYNKNKTSLHTYLSGKTETSFTIPDSVITIGQGAFLSCDSLTSVTIPNTVTSIGHEAFFDCDSLTSITIPNSVTSIGGGAFLNYSLTSVTFVGTIPSSGFSGFPDSYIAFLGDLRDKFYATDKTNGTPGTYTTTAPVGTNSTWTKQ